MRWDDKRYRSFSYEMKRIFGSKIIKLSLDGGFTCPNRDGTLGSKGCIFCGEEGAGEFTASKTLGITSQAEIQKEIMAKKWSSGQYVAYFQNFTNTYSTYEDLKQKYNLAISQEGVVALAIATRPDCLSEEVLDLLEEMNKKTFLWIELGLQTIHEKTAKFIRRGYTLDCYDEAIEQLSKRNIKVVTHLIIGLPTESKEEILASVKYVAGTNTWGVKLHSLYVQKGTDLHEYYKKNPFSMISKEDYITLIADSLEYLPPEMSIHRLTGDGKRSLLVEPLWSLGKRSVLSGIDQELKKRNSYQGINHKNILTRDECASGAVDGPNQPVYLTEHVTIRTGVRSVPATVVTPLTKGPYPAVVMNHGHGGSREENGGFGGIALALAEKGILTIRMDFPGCGESTEPFTENYISNMISDSNASLNYIVENHNVDQNRLGILGYSMGGRIALTIGSKKDSPYKSMALLAPSADPGEDVMVRFLGGEKECYSLETEAMSDKGYADFTTVFGHTQTLGHKWFSEMKASHPLKDIKNFSGSMLVVYGDQDVVISPAENERTLSAFPRAEKLILENADHGYGFFSNEVSIASKVEDTFADFFKNTL